jgi:hypothetical protein
VAHDSSVNTGPGRTRRPKWLLGARAYVAQHCKTPAARDQLAVYLNDDPGSGRTLGFYLEENKEAKAIFDRWLAPLQDLGAARRPEAVRHRHGDVRVARGDAGWEDPETVVTLKTTHAPPLDLALRRGFLAMAHT